MNILLKVLLFCVFFITGFITKAQVIIISGSLTTFVTCAGTVSTTQSFTISGSSLTSNLVIAAATGFEVSTSSGSGFAANLSLTPVGGTVNATLIYARITSSASGSPSGNISCSSTGATTKTIPINGLVKTLPDVTQPVNQALCHGAPTVAVNFTGTGGAGTTYNWTNNNPSIGLAVTGSGSIPSFTAINTGNTPVTATITVQGTGQAVGPRAYIPLSGTNFYSALAVIDIASNTVLTTFLMPLHPAGVCPSPDGSRIYITNRLVNFVTILNPIDNSTIGTIGVGPNPIFVKPSPDGSRLYVGNTTGNNVSVINTSTSSVIATIPVGTWPAGIAVSADGTKVYVANRDSDNVTVIDATTNTVITSIPIGGSGLAVALSNDGSRLYVDLQEVNGQVAMINTSTNLVEGTIPVGSGPTGMVMNHAGTRLYVTNQISNTVSVINTNSNTVIATIPTAGSGPAGVSISPDDSRLYLGYFNSNNVSVIDAVSYAVIASIPVTGSSSAGHGNFINSGTGPICTSTPKTFTIIVDPVPTVNAIADQNLCSGASSAVIHFSGGIPGATFNWVNSNTNIGLPANGTGDINPFTVTNSTGTTITAVVTVTPTYNGCSGTSKTFSLIVHPAAANVTIGALPAEVCSNNVSIPLTATPAGGTWTGNGITGNNFSPAAAGPGTAILTYSYTNSGGCTSLASVNINVKNCEDSLTEFCKQMQVIPNPNKGLFSIRVLTNRLRAFNARVIDAGGSLLKIYRFDGPVAYGTDIPFDLTQLPAGTYILELFTDVEKCTYRVVIVR